MVVRTRRAWRAAVLRLGPGLAAVILASGAQAQIGPVGPPAGFVHAAPLAAPAKPPDVRTLTHAAADAALAKAGYVGRVRSDPTQGDPAAIVYDQVPKPGAPAPPGSTVFLYLRAPQAPPPPTPATSGGVATEVVVPQLRGSAMDEAAARLSALGLSLGSLQGPAPAYDGALIANTSPAAGALVVGGTAVAYSLQPRLTVVPDLHGRTAKAAANILVQRGLRLGDPVGAVPFVTDALIDSSSPPAGAAIAPGTGVDFSLQPLPQVRVPPVVGQPASDALRRLDRAGLYGSPRVAADDTRTVTAQSPDAGAPVASGSAVYLTYGGLLDVILAHPLWLSLAGIGLIAATAALAKALNNSSRHLGAVKAGVRLDGVQVGLLPPAKRLGSGLEATWRCTVAPPTLDPGARATIGGER